MGYNSTKQLFFAISDRPKMGGDALQEQLEGLMDRMEAIEVMNKKMAEEQAKKNRDSEIKLALEDIKSQGAKKEVRPVECPAKMTLSYLLLADDKTYELAISFGRH